MRLQQLLSYTRKAIDEYQMIDEGDRIAVGISGGKDSLTLLYALHGLRRFYPKHFELEAVTVDLGFENLDLSRIQALCDELEVPYTIVRTEIAKIVFDERRETNPCSLCAKMRKGALNEAIKARGCNKVAYAHHRDDIPQTQILAKAGIRKGHPQALFVFCRQLIRCARHQMDGSPADLRQPQSAFERGALARPVLAYQPCHLPGLYLQRAAQPETAVVFF